MIVETVVHCAVSFASKDQYERFREDNNSCLILSWAPPNSILEMLEIGNEHARHAIYVREYDPKTNIFHCLNSWGREGEGNWKHLVKAGSIASEKEILEPEIPEKDVKRVYRVRFEEVK